MPNRPTPSPHAHPVDTAAFAAEWARVIATGYIGKHPTELDQQLAAATARLAAELHAPDPDVAAAEAVGRQLAVTHLISAAALAGTVELIIGRFEERIGCVRFDCQPAGDRRARLARLLGGLVAGHSEALRSRVQSEQARIHGAVDEARHRMMQAYQASETRFRTLFSTTPVGIVITTIDGRIIDTNPALTHMLGRTHRDLRGRSLASAGLPHDWPLPSHRASGGDRVRFEYPCQRADGSILWADVAASELLDNHSEPSVVYFIDDVTQIRTARQRLEHQATHDPLTGLMNRGSVLDQLSTAMADSDRPSLTVLYVDLDNFKAVNDTHGHHTGDTVLCVVAERLRAATRHDDVVGRLGGDEFLILLTGPADHTDQLTRLRHTLNTPATVNGHPIDIAASIGTATTRHGDPRTPEDILHAADIAMYRAKATSRDRITRSKDNGCIHHRPRPLFP
ncbi:diguanylate cyclase domain-containing protein [Nocardia sp. BMG51109]|uniref:diguanylate cyclase domain-containing protein n=1 Tax=Nocardia sp. BMG51109 TaxID=1056816 RepID=UPI000467BC47|nr:diguanylate cyclase [Nocardia sp. BMG51109]